MYRRGTRVSPRDSCIAAGPDVRPTRRTCPPRTHGAPTSSGGPGGCGSMGRAGRRRAVPVRSRATRHSHPRAGAADPSLEVADCRSAPVRPVVVERVVGPRRRRQQLQCNGGWLQPSRRQRRGGFTKGIQQAADITHAVIGQGGF